MFKVYDGGDTRKEDVQNLALAKAIGGVIAASVFYFGHKIVWSVQKKRKKKEMLKKCIIVNGENTHEFFS